MDVPGAQLQVGRAGQGCDLVEAVEGELEVVADVRAIVGAARRELWLVEPDRQGGRGEADLPGEGRVGGLGRLVRSWGGGRVAVRACARVRVNVSLGFQPRRVISATTPR